MSPAVKEFAAPLARRTGSRQSANASGSGVCMKRQRGQASKCLTHRIYAGVAADSPQRHLAKGAHQPRPAGAGGDAAGVLLPSRRAGLCDAGTLAAGQREQAARQRLAPGQECSCTACVTLAPVSRLHSPVRAQDSGLSDAGDFGCVGGRGRIRV